MSALSLSVEYSMETYGGTVLSGAARWRLGGIERRKVMGGGFGRRAACAAASYWALGGSAKHSECVAQPGA